MKKTFLSKTFIFNSFAAVCILGISISSCTSKKKTHMETTGTTENELTMLVGTYTSGTSKGIYSFRFNEKDGIAVPLSEVEIENLMMSGLLPMHWLSIKRKVLSNY